MVAANDIFQIDAFEHNEGDIKAALTINPGSEIFKGHFPVHPVVPGACMLQIVKDVLERALNTVLILKRGDNLKFISMIEPGNTLGAQLHISYKVVDSVVSLTAKIYNGDTVYFKFQGSFIPILN